MTFNVCVCVCARALFWRSGEEEVEERGWGVRLRIGVFESKGGWVWRMKGFIV